jgi:hypothetical protein
MTNNIQRSARVAGIFYLVIIIVGMFSVLFVRDQLIVSGDPAATAHHIMGSEFRWRTGIAADLLMHLCDVPVMLVVFILLRRVNKNLALLALLFNLLQTAVLVANKLNLIAALLPLGQAEYLKAFTPDQLYAQAYLAIKLHDIGFGVGLLFFGCTCLINGYLIFRSGFLPKTIGVLIQVAGGCYLVSNFTLLLAPDLAHQTFVPLMLPCLIAELSFCLWLIFKGVDQQQWAASNEKPWTF